MQVVINHKFVPMPADPRTKCGSWPNFGAERRPGSKWDKVQNSVWPAVFEQGETMPLSEFQSRWVGLLRSVGFQSNYSKRCATMSGLKNGLIHSGAISIVE